MTMWDEVRNLFDALKMTYERDKVAAFGAFCFVALLALGVCSIFVLGFVFGAVSAMGKGAVVRAMSTGTVGAVFGAIGAVFVGMFKDFFRKHVARFDLWAKSKGWKRVWVFLPSRITPEQE